MDKDLPSHVSFPQDSAQRPCPACSRESGQRFYEVLGIPIHSCVLLDDPKQAMDFPLGDLSLAHCPDCGFIYNDCFVAESLDYSSDYQESQGASATFRAFLDDSARKLIERTDLRAATVLEIGCGYGDFLAKLASLGVGRVIGIDPSATAGQAPSAPPFEFRQKLYEGSDFDLPVKAIACRHTLEHLPAVDLFMAQARAHLATVKGEYLFIEVPDVLRVLREGAFWDLYHEHCSYFTQGSLERLALGTGFAPDYLELVYAGQYLQLTARAVPGATEPPPRVDDRAAIQDALATFRSTCSTSLKRLGARILEMSKRGQGPTCLWGAGSKATGFLTTLGRGDLVAAVVDIDPAKQGKYVAGTGHPIIEPAALKTIAPALVLVMNPIYLDEIRSQLNELGIQAEVEAV